MFNEIFGRSTIDGSAKQEDGSAAGASGTAVAVIGAGSIGLSMSLVFARAGLRVALCDSDSRTRESVAQRLEERLALLRENDLPTGDQNAEGAGTIERIRVVEHIEDAVDGADLVLECTPEILEIKREVFQRLDVSASGNAILASVSSAFVPSEFAADLSGRDRCLVLHPANPPFLIPVVEVVPGPFTSSSVVDRAVALLDAAGMTPVQLSREITGFAYNRLQGALLREAYCLVRDGILDVQGIDALVREGLGMRWAVIGPFETADLNTRGGIEAHARRLGPAYHRMGLERGQNDPWTDDLVAHVNAARRETLPLEEWEARVSWRDSRLAALRRHLDERRALDAAGTADPLSSTTARSTR